MTTIELKTTPRALALSLAAMVAALDLFHLATMAAVFLGGMPRDRRMLVLFDLGKEGNLPTMAAGGMLALAAGLLAAAGAGERRLGRPDRSWALLACVFLFLAVDETVSLHENLIGPTTKLLRGHATGLLKFAWVLPYGLLVGELGVSCLGFLKRLPRATALAFVAAGAVYVGGAAGMEMIGGLLEERCGRESLAFALEVLVEETLEMAGLVLFIHALARHIRDHIPGFGVRLSAG